jgi:hypothetical protein
METTMVTRRRVLIAIGFVVAAFGDPSMVAAQNARKTKAATITLKVDGMG